MKNINMVKQGGTWVAVQAKNKSKAIALGATALLASTATIAADYSTQITAAETDGTSNVTLVIGACIAIAVLGFGVRSMLSWFGSSGK